MAVMPLPDDEDPFRVVLSAIRKIEDRYGLRHLRANGLPVWTPVRPLVAERLIGQLAGTAAAQTRKHDWRRRMRALAINLTIRNPFLRWRRADHLVVRWARTRPDAAGQLREPLSQAVGDSLGSSVLYVDAPGQCTIGGAHNWSGEAVALLGRILRVVLPMTGRAGIEEALAEAERDLGQELGVEARFAEIVIAEWRATRARALLWKLLLRLVRPARIHLVVAHAHPSIVLAGRSLGIPVADVQHGLLGIAYDWLDPDDDLAAPDALLLFGSAWRDAIPGQSRLHTAICGTINRADLDAVLSTCGDREAYLVIISQPMIRRQLIRFTVALACEARCPPIVFRMHPGDDLGELEKEFEKAGGKPDGVTFSQGGGGAETLRIQACAAAQLGVFSTAIVEGMALGTRTYILKAPGWHFLEPFATAGYGTLVSEAGQLIDDMTNRDWAPRDVAVDSFFARWDPAGIQDFVTHNFDGSLT